ncbi:MAG: Rieske (2Fe-2S) protein, partial [Candidatus Marinimicrobia bacterium]|nr:Rieske (2Fe-2S) protein [Candidatus Neomarinimicrobiota bacterium]
YGLQFLFPRRQEVRYRSILVGTMDQLAATGSKTFQDLSGREMVLVQTPGGLKAISTECTHLGCKVYWQAQDAQFFCPCHEGYFDQNGNVTGGPPPRPLESLKVEVDENELIFVHVREV